MSEYRLLAFNETYALSQLSIIQISLLTASSSELQRAPASSNKGNHGEGHNQDRSFLTG